MGANHAPVTISDSSILQQHKIGIPPCSTQLNKSLLCRNSYWVILTFQPVISVVSESLSVEQELLHLWAGCPVSWKPQTKLQYSMLPHTYAVPTEACSTHTCNPLWYEWSEKEPIAYKDASIHPCLFFSMRARYFSLHMQRVWQKVVWAAAL